MNHVQWSEPAIDQLQLIHRPDLRLRVHAAVGGLARLPLLGRIPPEVRRFPELKLPDDLRQLVFPKLVLVFYRFDRKRKTVRILGMAFRGQDVGADWFERFLTAR